MSRYSDRWFSRFSDDWFNITTKKGFLGGLLSIAGNVYLFGFIIWLASISGIEMQQPNMIPSFFIILLSAVIGGANFYIFQKNERMKELATIFSGRIGVMVVVYGVFSLLTLYNVFLAILSGIAYVFGKAVFLIGFNILTRL